jgi:large subunit ribosomal protein L4
MVRQALCGALADRAAQGRLLVVEGWSFEVPSTKDALAALSSLGAWGRTLVVLSRQDERAYKSFRNIGWVDVALAGELAAYDVLCADWVVFTRETLPGENTWTEAPAREDGASSQEASLAGGPAQVAPGTERPRDEAESGAQGTEGGSEA